MPHADDGHGPDLRVSQDDIAPAPGRGPGLGHEGLADDPRACIVVLMSSFVHGGAERHAITLINHFSRSLRVVLVYLKPDLSLLPHVERARLADLVFLDAASRKLDFDAVRRLTRLIDTHRPKLVLCVNIYPLMYLHLALRKSRAAPVIVDIFHTTLLRTWKEQAQMVLYRPFIWATDQMVFVCQNQRSHWRRRALFSRRNDVIHNGVDTAYFAPRLSAPQRLQGRARHGWRSDDRVVGISAVLRPEKAHRLLLEAVARLKAEGLNWKVLIIGDGPERAALEADVLRLGLLRDVHITGLLPDVREAIELCDVMALVSVSETFSIAALEAMALGKPMVMSDVGGAREQVTHGVHGFLFASRDADALADVLRECAQPGRLPELARQARARVEKEFSLQAMLGAYGQLLARHLDR